MLHADIGAKLGEGRTACMYEGSTSYQTDTGKAGEGRVFRFFGKVHGDEAHVEEKIKECMLKLARDWVRVRARGANLIPNGYG